MGPNNVRDPKLLKKAAPRDEVVTKKDLKPVSFVPDFPGESTVTGKIGEKKVGKFCVYTERLDAGSCSATYYHPKKSKVISVVYGVVTVVVAERTTIENEVGFTRPYQLKVGQSLEIQENWEYVFHSSEPCVLVHTQEPSYEARLEINTEHMQKGITPEAFAYAPTPRYQSKAVEQLKALSPEAPFREGNISPEDINNMPDPIGI